MARHRKGGYKVNAIDNMLRFLSTVEQRHGWHAAHLRDGLQALRPAKAWMTGDTVTTSREVAIAWRQAGLTVYSLHAQEAEL